MTFSGIPSMVWNMRIASQETPLPISGDRSWHQSAPFGHASGQRTTGGVPRRAAAGDLAADHPEPLVLGGEPLPARRPLLRLRRARPQPTAARTPGMPRVEGNGTSGLS